MSESDGDYISECIKFQRVLYSPMKTKGFLPDNGSEVFVRHIPPEDTEKDLLQFFQTVGKVFQVRLMMNENGTTNRGFGYITFFDATTAKKAVTTLNHLPYKKDNHHYLLIESSLNNCRLFIGGIPTFKRKDQVWQELYSKGVKNIIDVIMYRSYSDRAENRGFVFVEFRTHEEAAHFRAKYGKSLKLWDSPVVVDWSVPIPQVDEDVMNTVKIIYLRNLDVCQTREQLQATVLNFTSKATIEKVYKFKNYAFIHLTTRQYAEHLLEDLKEHYKTTPVEVTWAKPPSKFTTQDYRHSRVSHLSTNLFPKIFTNGSPSKKLISCCCTCCKSPKNFQDKTASQPTLSRVSSSSSLPTTIARSLSPYETFYREFSTGLNAFQTTSTFSPFSSFNGNTSLCDFARNEHDFNSLQESSTRIGVLGYAPSNITVPNLAGRMTPGNCMGILPVLNTNQSTPQSIPKTLSSRESNFDHFKRSTEDIYWNSPKSETSRSSSHSPNMSMLDLEIVPRNMTLSDIQDFIGDILD